MVIGVVDDDGDEGGGRAMGKGMKLVVGDVWWWRE